MMRLITLHAALLAALGCVPVAGQSTADTRPRPNVVIIVAEMFIGATDGLGHRIIDAQISYQLEDMYGSILVTGVMGYGLNAAFLLIEKNLVHWSGK